MTLLSSATRWVAAQQQSWETCSALRCSHFIKKRLPVCLPARLLCQGGATHVHILPLWLHMWFTLYLVLVHCASWLLVVQCIWCSARHWKVSHHCTQSASLDPQACLDMTMPPAHPLRRTTSSSYSHPASRNGIARLRMQKNDQGMLICRLIGVL